MLRWANIVCQRYGVPVDNFSTSFSDGRALCLLVHHYLPEQLELDSIETATSTTVTMRGVENGQEALAFALDNERSNFRLAYNAIKQLHGVPYIIKYTDMSNTLPDERVVIVFLSYLSRRLLELSHDRRAAITIQRSWRRYWDSKLEERRERIAINVQAYARGALARRQLKACLLYTSPSPRDQRGSRMPSSA